MKITRSHYGCDWRECPFCGSSHWIGSGNAWHLDHAPYCFFTLTGSTTFALPAESARAMWNRREQLPQTQSSSEALATAVEYGFRQAEKGHNLNFTLQQFHKLLS